MERVLPRSICERIDEVIQRWDLHNESEMALPVPIMRLARDEGWRIGWGCEWPLYGFAVFSQSTRVMRINDGLADDWVRFTVAHEMGHQIAGHTAGTYTLSATQARDQMEREADIAALALLIPAWLWDLTHTPAEVARRCRVPLVHVQWLWQLLALGGSDADDATISQRATRAERGQSART